jgi:hypothetical protein
VLSIVHPVWQGLNDGHTASTDSLTLQHSLTRSSSSSWSFALVDDHDDDEPDTPRADKWLHAGPSVDSTSTSRSHSDALREASASKAVPYAKVRLQKGVAHYRFRDVDGVMDASLLCFLCFLREQAIASQPSLTACCCCCYCC